MDARSVAPEAAPRKRAVEELLAAAEEVAGYLGRKEAHCPPEMLDGHEARYRRRLERAVKVLKS